MLARLHHLADGLVVGGEEGLVAQAPGIGAAVAHLAFGAALDEERIRHREGARRPHAQTHGPRRQEHHRRIDGLQIEADAPIAAGLRQPGDGVEVRSAERGPLGDAALDDDPGPGRPS